MSCPHIEPETKAMLEMVGRRVDQIRKDQKLTVIELASRAKTTYRGVAGILRGDPTHFEKYDYICRVLGIQFWHLLMPEDRWQKAIQGKFDQLGHVKTETPAAGPAGSDAEMPGPVG